MHARSKRFLSYYLPIYIGMLSLAAFILVGWRSLGEVPMLIAVIALLTVDFLFGTQWKEFARLPAFLVRLLWMGTALYYAAFIYLLFSADKPVDAFIQDNSLPLFAYLILAGLPFIVWQCLLLTVAAFRLHQPDQLKRLFA